MIPLPDYVDVRLLGWEVKVERAFYRTNDWVPVRQELENQLYRITRAVPQEPLKMLRWVPIWVHRNNPVTQCMAYHPGAQWLKDHGANPAMEKGIEIGNADNFLTWTHAQPWMVLHELAHAYHDRFLDRGFENEKVKKRYEAAVASKRYDDVLRYNGKRMPHYAKTNPMEFFAEATEAYFGQNDFYPFVRAELQTSEPDTFALMQEIWNR